MASIGKSLGGNVAIITGGGTGLGKAMALTMAKAGADIVVASRRAQLLEQTVKEAQHCGVQAIAIPTDISKSQDVNEMVDRTLSELGRIDILINNAGLLPEKFASIEEITDEQWRESIEINLSGVFYTCRAVGKAFLAAKKGKVINVAAGGGVRGARNNYAYCAAKAGVISFSYCLALSWAGDNIQVNCVVPGFFPTHIHPGEDLEKRAKFIPAGRGGTPEEMGDLALFLASSASDYLTGGVFTIDGGALAGGMAPTGYIPRFCETGE